MRIRYAFPSLMVLSFCLLLLNACQNNSGMDAHNRAIKLDPENALSYLDRGLKYEELGQYERAIIDYTKSIELYPTGSGVYVLRGGCYTKIALRARAHGASVYKTDFGLAITDFNKAIELNPSTPDAYFSKGYLYYVLGKHERAITNFTKAIEIDPNDVGAYVLRKESYEELGQHDLAIADSIEASLLQQRAK